MIKRSSVLLIGIVLSVLLLICASGVQAQLLCDPSAKTDPGCWEFGGLASFGSVEYETENFSGGGEVERALIGGYTVRGINETLDVFGAAAYIAKAEAEGYNDDGDGFMAAVGLRISVDTLTTMNFSFYGQLHHISETYGSYGYYNSTYVNGALSSMSSGNADLEGSITELLVGICGRCELDQMSVYGALDVVPFSDGELEGGFSAIDMERDSMVALRLGAAMNVGDHVLRAEIGLIGEETFTLAFGKQF